MNFYTIKYFENQSNNSQFMQLLVGALIIVGLLVLVFQFYRHRDDNKYRELIIILVLFAMLILGIQVNNYQTTQTSFNQSSQMALFLKNVIKEKKLKSSEVACNQTALTNQMVLKLKNDYYQVAFNSDFSSYELIKANLVNNEVNIIK